MRRRLSARVFGWLAVGVFVLATGGAIGWWQRVSLQAWYAVHGLSTASDADRDVWAVRTASLGNAALPALARCLRRPDTQACANARAALALLAGPTEKHRGELANWLADRFPSLGMAGQAALLELLTDWLRTTPGPHRALTTAAARLLPSGGRTADKEVRRRTLMLAALLLNGECDGDERTACRELARVTLQDPEPALRVDAVRMASAPSLNLLRQVALLLNDPNATVRQTAMAAVGCAPEAIATDDLLHSLHDTDADVRRLCAAALRGRGLRNEDVTLGRLITDTRAAVRLQVLEHLGGADLEPGIWLRRLSQDPAPAVRAAAVRVAVESRLDLRDQMERMARNDPSATVRQLATHYLSRQKNQQRQSFSRQN